jgi:hypothetical protein
MDQILTILRALQEDQETLKNFIDRAGPLFDQIEKDLTAPSKDELSVV